MLSRLPISGGSDIFWYPFDINMNADLVMARNILGLER